MADERVNFVLSARDQASATLSRVKGEMNALGGAAGKTAGPLGRVGAITGGLVSPAALATGGLLAAGAAIGTMAQAAMDEERGISVLTAAIQANDSANVKNIGSIEETIRARENLAFADDEQRESLGPLIAITRDSTKALELQRIAMDLARLKGMDLATASNLIGKVYGGNLGVLSRYGIQLEKGATATEALAEIQRRAAGQAEEFAETTSGAMQSAGMVIEDLSEDIGATMLPVLKDIALTVRDDVVPALRDMGDGLADARQEADDWLGPADETLGLVNRLSDAVLDFGANFREAEPQVKATAQAIGTDVGKMSQSILDRMLATGEDWDEAWANIRETAETHAANMSEGNRSHLSVIAGDFATYGNTSIQNWHERMAQMPQSIRDQYEPIRHSAYQAMVEYAKGLMDAQDEPRVALDAMHQIAAEELTRTEELAYLKGALSSKELNAGLMSELPGTRAAAEAARQAIITRLETLGASAWDWGYNISNELAAGMRVGKGVVVDAAGELGGAIAGQIAIRSEPKDPTSPLRGITQWGYNMARTIAVSAERGTGLLRQAGSEMAAAIRPEALPVGTMGAGSGSPGGGAAIVINFNSQLPTTPSQAQAVVRTILPELVRELDRQRKS